MPRQLDGKLIRFALNTGSTMPFVDQITSAAPQIPICDLRIEVGLFYHIVNADPVPMDLTGITSITATFKALGAGGVAPAPGDPALIPAKTIAYSQLNAGLTVDTWDDLSACHGAFVFPEAETAALSAGKVWLVFTALLGNGKTVALKFGIVQIVQDGAGIGGVPPNPVTNYYTAAQADTRFLAMRLGITTRSGGGAAAIDGIATAGGAYPVDSGIVTRSGANNGAEIWFLTAGTDASDPGHGIVRPQDYNAGTNAIVWKQLF